MQEASKAIANTAPEVVQGGIAKVSCFPCKWCLKALSICRESNNEGNNKRETGPLRKGKSCFSNFCDNGQTSVTLWTACRHDLPMVIHLLTKIHRHMQAGMDLG